MFQSVLEFSDSSSGASFRLARPHRKNMVPPIPRAGVFFGPNRNLKRSLRNPPAAPIRRVEKLGRTHLRTREYAGLARYRQQTALFARGGRDVIIAPPITNSEVRNESLCRHGAPGLRGRSRCVCLCRQPATTEGDCS